MSRASLPIRTKFSLAGLLLLVAIPGRATEPQSAAPVSAAQRPVRICESCLRSEAFREARKKGDVAAADALVPALLADGKRDDVAEYLVYDRQRCTEALALLEPERRDGKPKGAYDTILGALVCEAARLEATDPAESMRLLTEALDKEQVGSEHQYQSELYQNLAQQAVLNEAAIRFLIRHQLDGYRPGYAIEAQIGAGRVENVRRLLALGTDPNEMHGSQHAALGETLDLLETTPEVALQIAEVLLQAGADPAMLLDFSEEPERSALRSQPARKRFDSLLAAAQARLARTMPVRLQFYDLETPYARFDVVNRSGSSIVLDSWRDSEGFEYGGDRASIEFRFAPGTQWVPYDFNPQRPLDHKCMTRVLLQDGGRTTLRVPFDPALFVRSPPGLELRLRIPSAGGVDYLSVPFALHDNGRIRGMWPRDPSAPEPRFFTPGAKLELPAGLPKATEEGSETAPHSRPVGQTPASCPKS